MAVATIAKVVTLSSSKPTSLIQYVIQTPLGGVDPPHLTPNQTPSSRVAYIIPKVAIACSLQLICNQTAMATYGTCSLLF